ncbi:efflux RND transporter periplasmic adaptor subunit [Henriciella marina]|uniref:Efflux RND transporter periplasmic adaptor subunit n=1 Tax=Henriciella marina TaxID=453851 RepID=A0ABT4LT82_9PROT|nr:efflux RND transporter periplasmic adaptor subunit [Henriciella marina]MCZ4297577.1 efflux RND transporter periplasmic adaptor subunit [Henriciella marina]
MKRIITILLPVIVLVVIVGTGFALTQIFAPPVERAEEQPRGLSVFAEAAEETDLDLKVRAQGEVRPKRQIVVAPQIAGRISYVSSDFLDGGFIRQGQVLVRLEAADYELAVTRARSGVASAQQALAREQAEADLAEQDLADLGIEDASPLARREPQLAEAQANLDSAKALLADAQLALNRTAVTAPFSGRVRERSADLGQFVSPGQALGTIFATDVVEVSLPLSDEELGRTGLPLAFAETADNPGPQVVFSTNVAGEPREWVGRVRRTAAALNPQTRLINVIAELDDPYGTGSDDGVPMAPGLFVNAEIDGRRIENVVRIPRSALRGVDQVFIGDGPEGRLEIRTVNVVYSTDDGAFVSTGVEDGELAVVSPIQAAFDGMSIQVVERMPDGSLVPRTPRKSSSDDAEEEAAAQVAGETEGAIQ